MDLLVALLARAAVIATVPLAAVSPACKGGMWLKDGSRKRTLGGVFLQLCRERTTVTERRKIFR